MKLNNNYYFLRHGEALSNKKDVISSWPEKGRFPLTQKGEKQIKAAAKKLKGKSIDLIFSSDLLRTRQTAGIVSKAIGVEVRFDKRLREYNFGVFNARPIKEFRKDFPIDKIIIRFKKKPKGGETFIDIQKRMYSFLEEINKGYKGKKILIISHEGPFTLLEGKVKGFSQKEFFKKMPKEKRIKTGELRQLKL